MRKLGVAVIGCGYWGKNHVRVLKELENANLIAVADVNESAAREVGEKYGIKWFSSYEEILKLKEVEAVTICTPTETHKAIALRAMEEGKHVLVEKPMTNTVEEAKLLVEKSKQKDVFLTVGFIERFNPAVIEARRLVKEGKIGEVILAHARRVSRRAERIKDIGVIKDLGIHDIDVILMLFEDNVEEVYAIAGNIEFVYEDYANIIMKFSKKRSAFVETNWLTPRKVRRLILTGTEGLINVEYISQEITIENKKGIYQPFLEYQEPLKLELKNFVNSILEDKEPKPNGEDGIKALMICDAAIKSSKEGKPIRIVI